MNQKQTSEAVQTQTVEPTAIYSPHTDVLEREESIELRIDLPGIEADQIELKYEEGTLSVAKTTECLHQEFGATHFRRTFTVPEGYDPDKIDASLAAGVLTLTLTKAEGFRPRRIAIR